MKPFKLVADYEPGGDQPHAIDALVEGLIVRCLVRLQYAASSAFEVPEVFFCRQHHAESTEKDYSQKLTRRLQTLRSHHALYSLPI